jgi:hypothetical protein
MPELLRKFFRNDEIMFWGTTIYHDVQILEYYRITISRAHDLQREIPNSIRNYPPGLYVLAKAYIQTKVSKNNPKIASIRRDGWTDIPLSYDQV